MNIQHKNHTHNHSSNKLSIALTFLCTVHCIATPILAIFLPVVTNIFHQYHWIELVLLVSIFILGTSSILHSYKDHHQNKIPAYIFFAGLIFLGSTSILEIGFGYEQNYIHFLNSMGGILCGIGQVYNLKLSN